MSLTCSSQNPQPTLRLPRPCAEGALSGSRASLAPWSAVSRGEPGAASCSCAARSGAPGGVRGRQKSRPDDRAPPRRSPADRPWTVPATTRTDQRVKKLRAHEGRYAMYANTRQASEYQRDLLARAQKQRQVARVLALRKAARRVARAERRLVAAQTGVLRARADLVS